MTAGTSVFGAYTVMKILLPLALMAVACEALAQDAQCVRERAAMVETIRDYARFEAGVLGPQGISERVLEAMGQTERHRFIPEHSCSVAYMDAPVVIGRVEMWRGGCRLNISVAASFDWRCLSGSTMAPFPHPAHRTGQADFPHPALGQDFTLCFRVRRHL